jgi:hypothetical protein
MDIPHAYGYQLYSLLADFKQGLQKSKLGDFADRIYPIEPKRKRITDTA